MAKVTSSSNRSKRKTTKPVTKGQNPQRANRQAVSTARVSQSGQAKPGSAASRVTTGQGGQSIRQPRAITNGNSATMRQIRAKAVQKQRMASGKTGVSGVAYALAKPVVDKAATHLGKKLGKALRPAGRAIDKALGIKSKPTGSKKRQKK